MSNSSGQHIFFVDDEPNVRQVIVETLEQVGFKVSYFANGEDCLEKLRSQKCDLLITDLRMPEMNGIELLKRARLLSPWVPVLIITGYGDIPTAVEGIRAGAVDFIEKPLDKKSFLEKIKSILQEDANHFDAFPVEHLTMSEMRVLKLIIEGNSNKEIGNLLSRSRRTIEAHRARLMRKLGADNLIDLVKSAIATKFSQSQTSQEPGDRLPDS